MLSKKNKVVFYDVGRKQFICECEIKDVQSFCISGDELIVGTGQSWFTPKEYKLLALPFSPKARDGDFAFYSANDSSALPNPFTSVNDWLPENRLESLKEFVVYPSAWSSYHHAVGLMEDERIQKILQ